MVPCLFHVQMFLMRVKDRASSWYFKDKSIEKGYICLIIKNLQMTAPKIWEQYPMCWNKALKEKTCIGCLYFNVLPWRQILNLKLLGGCKYKIYDLTTHFPFFMVIVCWGCELYDIFCLHLPKGRMPGKIGFIIIFPCEFALEMHQGFWNWMLDS